MYNRASELLAICEKENKHIYEVAIEREASLQGVSAEEVRGRFKEMIRVMKEACQKTLKTAMPSISGLTGGSAKKLWEYIDSGETLCGENVLKAAAYALSCFEVNTAMGKIVAAPTAGSCGILPGCLFLASEKFSWPEETLLHGFATAAAIGVIIEHNATLSGAEGGCQAECGSAAAMAAAALVEARGGTVEQAFHAAAMALKNVMGLICDPVAGLVEVPCAKRNSIGTANAMLCADMALSGIESFIPLDEVIDAMFSVGHCMPCELRETGLGGLAGTPTGVCARKKIFKE